MKFILLNIFFISYLNNNLLANDIINFGKENGTIRFSFSEKKPDDEIQDAKIHYTSNNDNPPNDRTYDVKNQQIARNLKYIFTIFTNDKSLPIIANNIENQISGNGIPDKNFSNIILLYHDGSSVKTVDSVFIKKDQNYLKNGFIAIDMEFERPNKNVFLAYDDIIINNRKTDLDLFSVFNIGVQGNLEPPNIINVKKNGYNIKEKDAISLDKGYILSEGNKLKNMFLVNAGSIQINPGNIFITLPNDNTYIKTELISSDDNFSESYAKTMEGNIIINNNYILINNDISNEAFFNAANGSIYIDTSEKDGDGNIKTNIEGSIIVMGTNQNNKINGFAKGKIINIQTGSLTVFVDSIGESNFIISDSRVSNEEAEENKININELTFSSTANNPVTPTTPTSSLKKSFIKSVSDIELSILTLKLGEKVIILEQDQYLMESESKATLNIFGNIDNETVNRLMSMPGNILGGSTDNTFSGFKFAEEVNITIPDTEKIGKNLTVTDSLIKVDNNNAKVTINNFNYTNNLTFNNNVVETENGGDVELTIKNFIANDNNEYYFNFNIDGSLIKAAGDATLNITKNVTNKIAKGLLFINTKHNMLEGSTNTFSGFKFAEEVNIYIYNTEKIGKNLTVTDSLIKVDNNNAKVTIDNFNFTNNLTFNNNVVETENDGDVELTIYKFTGDFTADANDKLKINGSLIKAAGNAILNIPGINNENLNNFILDKIESKGNVKIEIGNINLEKNKEFNGYSFKGSYNTKVAGNTEIIFRGNFHIKKEHSIKNLININDAEKDFSVVLNNNFFLEEGKISSLISLNNFYGNSSKINFNFASEDKEIAIFDGKIEDSLIYSSNSDIRLLNSKGGLNIQNSLFTKNEIALIANIGHFYSYNDTLILGNLKSNFEISNLKVTENDFKDTSLIYVIRSNNYQEDMYSNIISKSFRLSFSKIGAIVISKNYSAATEYNDHIAITSSENLEIENNEFLQSFVITNSKGSITIASGSGYETKITKNTIYKSMTIGGNINIGNTNSESTKFEYNKAQNGEDLGNYILKTNYKGSINILGKEISIYSNNTINSKNRYGLFETDEGNINIGDNNTERIYIDENKTNNTNETDTALMKTNKGNINFKAKNEIIFGLGCNNDYYSAALASTNGDIRFESESYIYIAGNRTVNDLTESKLKTFAYGKKFILKITRDSQIYRNNIKKITLGIGNTVFFNFENGIEIKSENSKNEIYKLKSQSNDPNDFNGAIFKNNEGKIDLKLKNLNIYKIDTPNSWFFKEIHNTAENIIYIKEIKIKSNAKMAGFYHSKSNNFKINGYNNDNDYTNFKYSGDITGMAAIKFGNEEKNADNTQYNDDAFVIKADNFIIKPNSTTANTVAGIVFTNPKYIETDINGNVLNQKGNLKIEIKNGGILNLDIPNKPSIAVIANKQNYGDGKSKKVFEFGKTIIEGEQNGKSKIKLSGYKSLQTTDDDSFNNGFENIKNNNNVGKSELIIGENIEEFDTVYNDSKFLLHEFKMESGKIIVHLDQNNKDRNLFQWPGNYRTLSNGEANKNIEIIEGEINFEANTTMDIDGINLNGDFILIQPGKFNINIINVVDFFKHDDDGILETRKIIKCSKDDGLVIRLGSITGNELQQSLITNGAVPEDNAKILKSFIETFYFNHSIDSNFYNFSENIYKLSKDIFKKDKSRDPIIVVIDQIQKPDSDSANVGAVGIVGLSSIKLASSILNDRIILPIISKNSDRVMLADAGGNLYNEKTNNSIELFTKINLGFGKLKTSVDNRSINNYGFLAGGDFGLLKNKMKIGTSIMFDYSTLKGSYRNSNIKSIIISLYSKYDIFELKNKDTLYTYGIFSYSHTWESEEAKFMNFENNSNKTANIISIDALTGYSFNKIGVIPEFGFGFIYGKQSSYMDNIGQIISSRNSVILSLKNNFRYNFPEKYLYDNMHIGFKFGLSYDILYIGSDGFNIKTPVGLEYKIKDSKNMDKFSFNYGTDFSYNLNSKSKISVSYDGIITKNLLNNRFSFEYRYSL